MITKNELLKQLKAFDAKGNPVIVHTSLKAVGEIEGGGETLLDALIEYYAKNGGILCVPSHTWKKLFLDLNDSYSCIGVLPSLAAAHPDGVRSLHPTHSMVVFGEREKVDEFVKNEKFVDSPTHPDGCYGNIFRQDGYVLLVGVGQEKNTCIHCVEEMLEVPDRLTDAGIYADIIYKDGTREKRHLRWFDPIIPDVSVNFGKFEPAFRHFGVIQDGTLGDAKVQFCRAEKMKEALTVIYGNTGGREILADNAPLDENLYK